jgi:hypothetical protein
LKGLTNNGLFAALLLGLALCGPQADSQSISVPGDARRDYYTEVLANQEQQLTDGVPPGESGLDVLRELVAQIDPNAYPDLAARSRILLALIEPPSSSAESHAADRQRRDHRRRRVRTTALCSSVVALSLFNIFWYVSDATYREYRDATSASEADRLKERIRTFDTLSASSGAVSVMALAVAIPLFVSPEGP